MSIEYETLRAPLAQYLVEHPHGADAFAPGEGTRVYYTVSSLQRALLFINRKGVVYSLNMYLDDWDEQIAGFQFHPVSYINSRCAPLPLEMYPKDLRMGFLRALTGRKEWEVRLNPARPRRARIDTVRAWEQHAVTRADWAKKVRGFVKEGNNRDSYQELIQLLNRMQRMGLGSTAFRVTESLEKHDDWEGCTPVQADCGHFEHPDNTHTVGGFAGLSRIEVCDSCFDEDVVYVDNHDAYAMRDDVYYWESDDCYHTHEEPSWDEDDDESDDDTGLLNYSANVVNHFGKDATFKTSSTGDFHMGVELETEAACRSDVYDTVQDMEDHFSGYAIYKEDGSLGSGGIEIVTKPTSLAVHLNMFGAWEPPKGLKAWNAGRCGMHVHVDSRAFTALTLGKFIAFFNDKKNATFVKQIAGRHPEFDEQARRYARYDCMEGTDLSSPAKVLKGKSPDRYVMVNTSNLDTREQERLGISDSEYDRGFNTVELRIFRASLRKERLLSQLEFTHALIMFCRDESYKNINGNAFLRWLRRNGGRYSNLCKWYGINNKHGAPRGSSTPQVETVNDGGENVPEVVVPAATLEPEAAILERVNLTMVGRWTEITPEPTIERVSPVRYSDLADLPF